MQALWLENQTLSLRDDLSIPQPAEGEALVRVRLAGICSTDLEMVRGYYPFAGIPGHEFVGEIVEVPDPALRGRARDRRDQYRLWRMRHLPSR